MNELDREMNKEVKEILKMFLEMYGADECKCTSQVIVCDCPVHGWDLSPSQYMYKEIEEKLKD